jgi:hypothetical protein
MRRESRRITQFRKSAAHPDPFQTPQRLQDAEKPSLGVLDPAFELEARDAFVVFRGSLKSP